MPRKKALPAEPDDYEVNEQAALPSTSQLLDCRVRVYRMTFHVVGESPGLLTFQKNDKLPSLDRMVKKQLGGKADPNKPRNPQQEFSYALYWLKAVGDEEYSLMESPDEWTSAMLRKGIFGLPSIAFRKSIVATGRTDAGSNMKKNLQVFRVLRDWIKIEHPTPPELVKHFGVIPGGGSTPIWRPLFRVWGCTFRLQWLADVFSPEQVVKMMSTAGVSVGVGNWRMEKGGNFGCFHIAGLSDIEEGTAGAGGHVA